ncbi:DUF5672 family protein [Pedobacter sp. CFBP9032]|uniref:DUF5672 family protein n=1 Tax=Pedobacter sp. CFBP9032 TaxID=3096539 RepID=UPI002A6A2191|nr:DUF5672 family protein [Pedobacter sp. CFBP9032]MDY0907443.1 DUF5672 family protein [Pedobacter sp. CFBP9032]
MPKPSFVCAIVIPTYKAILENAELSSISQSFKKLSNFHFYIVCPYHLDVAFYELLAKKFKVSLKIIRFNNKYFSSVMGYNQLLISINFFKKFIDYKFILICQLDVWIFKSDLVHWCNKNYDYIGAPWFHKMEDNQLVFNAVGNGGLSLRNVASHIKVLKSFSFITKPGYLIYLLKSNPSIKRLIDVIIGVTFKNNTYYLLNNFQENEDMFWSIIARRNFPWFEIAPKELALKFSIEMYPSSFIKTEDDLPFGCHAWLKYEPYFWKKFINYDIIAK